MACLLLSYSCIMSNIYLASSSKRRKEILEKLGYNFKIVKPKVDETFLEDQSIAQNLLRVSELKARKVLENSQDPDALVISGDTIVVWQEQVLGKPNQIEDARTMLQKLSDGMHEVITAYTVCSSSKIVNKKVHTKVFFDKLSEAEIDYYIERYKPLDKAGSYGIQEWIGMIGITHIEGDYYNVMGLPANDLYVTLVSEFGEAPN